MLSSNKDIYLDKNRRELQPSDSGGCCGRIIFADITKYLSGSVPWHWHEEIEVFIVTNGTLRLCVGNDTYLIPQSEGGMINTNLLHSLDSDDGSPCEVLTILFTPSLFLGGNGLSLYRRLTFPILDNPGITFLPFSFSEGWQKQIKDSIQAAALAYHQSCSGMELIFIEKMSFIWRLLLTHLTEASQTHAAQSSVRETRLHTMMMFIHQHYQESITLSDIARSANISTRECSRCFLSIISIPPIRYLTEYRIAQSRILLLSTELTVSQIALNTGFGSASYFSKVFTSFNSISPTEYRKKDGLLRNSVHQQYEKV